MKKTESQIYTLQMREALKQVKRKTVKMKVSIFLLDKLLRLFKTTFSGCIFGIDQFANFDLLRFRHQ
jgi:hypothetical protein